MIKLAEPLRPAAQMKMHSLKVISPLMAMNRGLKAIVSPKRTNMRMMYMTGSMYSVVARSWAGPLVTRS
jgi:hypothetical protein